jgi:hypothetical protein
MRDLIVAAAAQTVSLLTPTEAAVTDLDPELTDFCLRLHITPAIREFHDDEGESDPDLSNQSSDIEEESELKRFSEAFRMAQVTAMMKENKNKRGKYSKQSKKTMKRRMQVRIDLASKGFLPVDEFIKLKGNAKQCGTNAPTSEPDNIINAVREESEEGSDEANVLVQDSVTCADRSVNSTSEEESEEILPVNDVQLRLRHRAARMESEESTADDNSDDDGIGNYVRQSVSEDMTDIKETLTACEHLQGL